MVKYSQRNRFQVGDYWLSKQSRSPAWCRTWYDTKTEQTRRARLGTTDFEEAKQILTDWFIANQNLSKEDPSKITLAEIFAPFYEQHGSKLVSAYQAQSSLSLWLEFFGTATVSEATTVPEQERFQFWLKSEKGLGANTAHRIVSVGKTALNWAWKRGYLSSVPYILPVKKVASPPKGRPLEVTEIERLLEHAPSQHVRDFIYLMIGTAARPDAILDLTLGQCNLERRIIQLNPNGREQTKKYRPTVRMPEAVVPIIERRLAANDCQHVIAYHGRQIKYIRQAWRGMRKRAELDQAVAPYSLRHTMARWLRSQSVPAWEVAAQLGHKQTGMSTTEIYAAYDPAYLSQSVKAIDAFFDQFRVKTV